MVHLISTAVAQTGGQVATEAPPPGNPMFMIVAIMAIFYFLMVRPQNKARNEHQALLASLKKGDRVVTDGGIVGLIHSVEEDRVVIEVGDRVRIPFLKESVKGSLSTEEAGKE
ncbi:MAG: preprotein translocase subunit YajC [Myxococcota bacterium]|nr:preprotein translocase subunit YajC [Myxococcota bacterium]